MGESERRGGSIAFPLDMRKGTKGAPALRTGDGGLKILLPPVNSPHTPSPPHGHTAQQQHYNNTSNTTITPKHQQQPLHMW